jgi:hypothetical protein
MTLRLPASPDRTAEALRREPPSEKTLSAVPAVISAAAASAAVTAAAEVAGIADDENNEDYPNPGIITRVSAKHSGILSPHAQLRLRPCGWLNFLKRLIFSVFLRSL